jgi:sterol desaturase/sphingolipid hydroxylase (fatty acid hydroxylase superfamily)
MAAAVFIAAIAAALLEARANAYANRDEWRAEARTSCILGATALLIEALLPARNSAEASGAGLMLAVLVFFADDFLYYLSHRLAHRVAFFWASHAVHHSPRRYNFFTGLRQPPTWILTPAALAPVVLLSFGAPAGLVAACAGIRGLHHFLIHTERVRRLPRWIEYVFNTPSHHRVHHSAESRCLDRNFGGVLIIWDRLFGTVRAEPDQGVRTYGLVHPTGAGAWRTMIDPWRTLFARVRKAPGLAGKLTAIIGPPQPLFA